MLEITQKGTWYTVEIEYDGMFDAFKAHGTKEFNTLLEDLAHDCIIDDQTELAKELINSRKRA